jgi:hypothetical protein
MLLGAVLIGVLTSMASAQEFVVSQAPREVPVVQEPTKLPPTTAGIVMEIFNVKKPWQMLNPKAPAEYGDGRENVSYSEKEPGKPKGFILFALEW